MEDYLIKNKDAWNKRTTVHVDSDFYDLNGFLNGKSSLNEIELALLNEVKDKRLLHLQCHFGQDTLSLARLGAKCTGIDLSNAAILKAKELNKQLNLDATFICSDLYSYEDKIDQKFDLVFTSYGTIGWLPDINKWAKLISKALKPNGKIIFVEFHPFIWTMNEALTEIEYPYFNDEAIIEESTGTYADQTSSIKYTEVSWNHGLAEVFQALKNNKIQVEDFKEYNYSPYNCFKNLEEVEHGKFQFSKYKGMIPMVYSLVGKKLEE
ncbi:MAG: class I SAM-dependent methyltransferase [Lishizhenia sp.]